MQIYIHRNNEDFGPYSKEAVQEYVKQGVFQAYDYACYQGMSEWKTVSELLGISGPANPKGSKGPVGPKGKTAGAATAVAKAPTRTTRSLDATQPRMIYRRPVPVPKKGNGMIFLNLILAALVGGGIYLRMGGGGEQGKALMEKIRAAVMSAGSSATASNSAPATQAPAPAQTPAPLAAPVIAPIVSAIPVATVATPAPLPLPATVHIAVPVKFPAILNGQTVGSISVPQGTEVQLVKPDGDQLIINYKGGMVRIARNLTDVDAASRPVAPPAIAPAPAVVPGAPAVAPNASISAPGIAPAAPPASMPGAPASTPAGTPDATDPDASLGAGGN